MELSVACTTCVKTDCELRRCSKCKFVHYCSAEVYIHPSGHTSVLTRIYTKVSGQALVRILKVHPVNWAKIRDGNDTGRYTSTCRSTAAVESEHLSLFIDAYSDPVFTIMLQACFIIHFDLIRAPQFDKPIVATVELGIEPADLGDLIKIFTGRPHAKVAGMVQMNAFVPFSDKDAAAIAPNKYELWRQARDGYKKDRSVVGCSMAFVEIINGENRDKCWSAPLFIDHRAHNVVRKAAPLQIASPVTGEGCDEGVQHPLLHGILRTEMGAYDIKVIRDARAGLVTEPATFVRAKLARESIYNFVLKEHPLEKEKRIAIVY
ncbi:hypothetical protein C8R46DRAFT_1269744 [Mycena filopes]|nr:hypothetical protein C8R46DRAFT_1269744 [Mycena filopes]